VNAVALASGLCRGRGTAKTPIMGRAKRGIFCGKHIGFGNNVSFSNRKTRRSFKPNVHAHNLKSELLGETIRLNVSCHALRNIKKFGGLDNLILNKPRLVADSEIAQKLRVRMLHALEKKKLEEQGIVPDLPEVPENTLYNPKDENTCPSITDRIVEYVKRQEENNTKILEAIRDIETGTSQGDMALEKRGYRELELRVKLVRGHQTKMDKLMLLKEEAEENLRTTLHQKKVLSRNPAYDFDTN